MDGTTLEKVDFTEKFPDLYTAEHRTVSFVTVPSLPYLCVQGNGHPSVTDQFETAVQTLYGIAFSLKVYLKRKEVEGFTDYFMPPLETLRTELKQPKEKRQRQMLILQPGSVTEHHVNHVYEVAKMKHQDKILPTVKRITLKENTCIQTLHIWPYDKQEETCKFLYEEAKKANYTITGPHHEIYLNDARRTPQDKLQTIVRYQVTPL